MSPSHVLFSMVRRLEIIPQPLGETKGADMARGARSARRSPESSRRGGARGEARRVGHVLSEARKESSLARRVTVCHVAEVASRQCCGGRILQGAFRRHSCGIDF